MIFGDTSIPVIGSGASTLDDVASLGGLVVVDDLHPAQWLTESMDRFAGDVASLLPGSFDAYARIFHPAHNGGERVSWAQVARANSTVVHSEMQFTRLIGYASRHSAGYRDTQPGVFDEPPAIGTLPAATAVSITHTLAAHTTTTSRCWFAVWDGWGDLDEAFNDRPTFVQPGRNYHLAHGPLAGAAQSLGVLPASHTSCNLWWPDDHAWCVATDIDLDSTYVGGSGACIDELLANPDLEAAQVNSRAGVAADSDTLNPVEPE